MKAKDFLNQLKKLDKLIENKIADKAYWMGIACSTTAPGSRTVKIKNSKDELEEHAMTRVKSSSNQHKMSDAIDRYNQSKEAVLSPSTMADYYRMKKYFDKILHVDIHDVTTSMIQSLIGDMAVMTNRYGKRLL